MWEEGLPGPNMLATMKSCWPAAREVSPLNEVLALGSRVRDADVDVEIEVAVDIVDEAAEEEDFGRLLGRG